MQRVGRRRVRRRARALRARAIEPVEAQPGERVDLVAGADAQRERVVELGQRALQHTRRRQQPPRPRPALREQTPELGARVLVERPRPGRERLEPLEQRVARLVALAQAAPPRARPRAPATAAARPRSSTRSRLSTETSAADDPVATTGAARRRLRGSAAAASAAAAACRPWWRARRGSSAPYTSWPNTPSRRPSVAKIKPDLAARDHADADEQPVARAAEQPGRGHELADDGDGEQHGGDAEHLPVGHRLDVGVDADLEEEHGDEQVPDRRQLAADAVRGRRAGEREAGDERADDRREVGQVRELGEREREREREHDERARGTAVAPDQREQRRREPQADRSRDHDEADRDERDLEDADRRDAAFGDDARDDGEDHEAEHVVGDRRTEHGARFDRRERAEVAEHARGDADARRGQRGADEQRFLAVEAEAEPGSRSRSPSGRRRR